MTRQTGHLQTSTSWALHRGLYEALRLRLYALRGRGDGRGVFGHLHRAATPLPQDTTTIANLDIIPRQILLPGTDPPDTEAIMLVLR